MIGFIVCRIQAHSIDARVCVKVIWVKKVFATEQKKSLRMTQKNKLQAQRKWIPLNYHIHRKSSLLSCMDTNTRFTISDWRIEMLNVCQSNEHRFFHSLPLLRINPQCNEHIINSLGLGFFSPELWITTGTVIFYLKLTVATKSEVEKMRAIERKKIIVWTTIFTVWMVSVLSKWKCIGNWWLNVFPHTYSFGRRLTNAAPTHPHSLSPFDSLALVSFWNRSITSPPRKIEVIKGKSQNVIRSR